MLFVMYVVPSIDKDGGGGGVGVHGVNKRASMEILVSDWLKTTCRRANFNKILITASSGST